MKNTDKGGTDKSRYTLSLMNANGATVASRDDVQSNTSVQLDTSTYAAGMYLLVLKGSNGTVKSTKVVKINQ